MGLRLVQNNNVVFILYLEFGRLAKSKRTKIVKKTTAHMWCDETISIVICFTVGFSNVPRTATPWKVGYIRGKAGVTECLVNTFQYLKVKLVFFKGK